MIHVGVLQFRLALLLSACHCVAVSLSAPYEANRIPIGALFDLQIPQAITAFKYQINKHNNSTTSVFRMDKYEEEINVSDPYEFKNQLCSIMAQGVFAVVGFANTSSRSSVTSYANNFHMPFVTPSALTNASSDGTSGSNYILHMRPLYDLAIIDVIKYYRWKKLYYIYDTVEALDRLQRLYETANQLAIEIDVFRVPNPHKCYAMLRELDRRNLDDEEMHEDKHIKEKHDLDEENHAEKYIVLDIQSVGSLQAILTQIQNLGMNRATYHYLIGGLVMDELDLQDFKHGGVNITGFRLLDRDNPRLQTIQREWTKLSLANPTYWKGMNQKIGLDSALTMDSVTVIVRALSTMINKNKNVFRNTFRRGKVYNNGTQGVPCVDPCVPWLLGPDIMPAFSNVEFEGVTGKVAFDENGYRKDFKLDVIELGLNRAAHKVGTWDKQRGLNITLDKTSGIQDSSKNKTRIVTSILSPPYLMKRKTPEDGTPLVGNERYEGFCADVTEIIAKIVGFDYVLKLVDDNKYGQLVPDTGKWNGMVGELTETKAHIAVAPLTISSARERVIDFSKPYMNLGISIMIKKPEKQKPGVFSFMDPLSPQIWMCIVFSYLGVSIVLFLVSRFSPYEWQIEDSVNGPSFTNDFTILNSLWFSLGAFMQQGCDISPRSLSGRIVGSAWWFFTLIIISSYTANLAAFLTVERMLTPIESADDLAKQTTIQYGTLNSGSTQTFFKESKIAVYKRMWTFMETAQPSVFVEKTESGVKRVSESKGKYAFLLESSMNDYYNQRKPCNTMMVGGALDSKGYGVATPIKSELRKEINLAVLKLREDGTLQKLKKKWWYDKGECNADAEGKGQSQSALTLSNVAGVFYILIGGLGLSMIISLLEFLYKSRLESNRQKKHAAAHRSKTRLSVRGTPERENGGYSYSAPTRVVSLDGLGDYACASSTHTDV